MNSRANLMLWRSESRKIRGYYLAVNIMRFQLSHQQKGAIGCIQKSVGTYMSQTERGCLLKLSKWLLISFRTLGL